MMNGSRTRCASVILLGLVGAGSSAQPLVFEVDPARSTVEISIQLVTAVGSPTDTDSSPVTGLMYLALDSFGATSSSVLYDLQLQLSETLDYNWSFGFAGSADATLTDGGLFDAAGGSPKGPVPVSSGVFSVPDVPIQATGIAVTNYNILIVGSDSVTQDLSAQEPIPTAIGGTLTNLGPTMEVSSTVTYTDTVVVVEGVASAVITASATIVGVAQILDCPADIAAPSGTLNFFDISAFIALYNAQDPGADFTADGQLNFFDISAFIGLFNAGCP